MLSFSGVLIDMDGVLLDTERVAERCWHEAEKETGFFMPDGFYFTLIGQSMKLIEPRLEAVMDPECDVAAFLAAANRHYDHALAHHEIPVKSGARELLQYLREQEIPACLATSTFHELAARKLSSTGLLSLLPVRVCGNEIEHSKPAPDIYRAAADRLGLAPERLIAIEDSENGLRSALEAGCRVIHVPDIAPVSEDVRSRVHETFDSLDTVLSEMQRGGLAFQPAR